MSGSSTTEGHSGLSGNHIIDSFHLAGEPDNKISCRSVLPHLGLFYLALWLEGVGRDAEQLVRLAGPNRSQGVTLTVLPGIIEMRYRGEKVETYLKFSPNKNTIVYSIVLYEEGMEFLCR